MVKTASEFQARSDRFGQILSKYIPSFIKPIIKSIYFFFLDMKYFASGGSTSMVPPPSKHFIGIKNYEGIGNEFFYYFKNLGGLEPQHKVLDVGCGSGRMAVPLTRYLSKQGEYSGFDIIESQVNWARKNISNKFPNFSFQHVKVINDIYNKDGEMASGYKFPFKDKSFDFVFLTSVFTHMLPADVENYFKEIFRVLKHKGSCFITFFLLNKESKGLIDSGQSSINFRFSIDTFLTNDLNKPEEAIAYEEDRIRNYFTQNNLQIIEPIHHGSWCNRKEYLSYQDIIIAKK